jgi:hypothetical protein
MKTIKTRRQLLDWLIVHLIERKPQVQVNDGIVSTFEKVLWELRERGEFRMEQERWGEWLDLMLLSIANSKSSTLRPLAIIGFTSTIFGEAIPDEVVSIDKACRVLIEMLLLDLNGFVRLGDDGGRTYVTSTQKCEQKFGTTVRVKLRDE